MTDIAGDCGNLLNAADNEVDGFRQIGKQGQIKQWCQRCEIGGSARLMSHPRRCRRRYCVSPHTGFNESHSKLWFPLQAPQLVKGSLTGAALPFQLSPRNTQEV